jgi:hypothetical protein
VHGREIDWTKVREVGLALLWLGRSDRRRVPCRPVGSQSLIVPVDVCVFHHSRSSTVSRSLEADALTAAIFTVPAMAGDVFHFTNAGAGSYPFTTFAFPPPVAPALSGFEVDGRCGGRAAMGRTAH